MCLNYSLSQRSTRLCLSLDIQGLFSNGLCLENYSYPSLSLGLSFDNQEFPSLSLALITETDLGKSQSLSWRLRLTFKSFDLEN